MLTYSISSFTSSRNGPVPLENISEDSENESDTATIREPRATNQEMADTVAHTAADARPYSPSCSSSNTILPRQAPPTPLTCAAEEDSDSEFDAVLVDALSALDLDISTFTTRDLLQRTIEEAKRAVVWHLDTIRTTLALLEALNGFSPTITTLKKEMEETETACLEKLTKLEVVEIAVKAMQFGDEIETAD
jgi:hypothetical protein